VKVLKEAGAIPANKRLVIIESEIYGKGWGWISGLPGEIDPKEWHTEGSIIMGALNDLNDKKRSLPK